MGVVYKAEDTKLERTVALKFLAAHLLNDEEAKARFLREAKAAAGLHHPNICPVYEIAEAQGKTFLSMAFIEGRPLETRIEQGPLPLKEALDIGRQIAEGLEAAHEKGVVHRDIKPANVMVDAKGHATIMDFGLAHLTEASRLTKADQTMGTVAYMSPEQAQGMEVDNRSDVWALGVVLYEMVCGQRPFQGQYDQALLYEIVHQEPEPLTGVRAGVPMELEFIVGKCLAKDRNDRPSSAEEIARDLRTLGEKLKSGRSTVLHTGIVPGPPAGSTQSPAQAESPSLPGPLAKYRVIEDGQETGDAIRYVAEDTELHRSVAIRVLPQSAEQQIERAQRRKQTVLLGAAVLGVLLTLVFAFFPLFSPAPVAEAPLRRFAIAPPASVATNLGAGIFDNAVGISPNARHIAFVESRGQGRLWVQDLDQEQPRAIEGTEGARSPFWSPNSDFIGFAAGGELKKISVQGGVAARVCELPGGNLAGGTWSPDGEVIVFSSGAPAVLYEVPGRGGTPNLLISPEESEGSPGGPTGAIYSPHFLPSEAGARVLVFTFGLVIEPTMMVQNVETGQRELLGPGALPFYSSGGHLVYQPSRTTHDLWALPFSLDTLRATGEAFPISENSRGPTVAADGTLVYLGSSGSEQRQLVWLDRGGERIGEIGEAQEGIGDPVLSPDGQLVAVTVGRSPNHDVWVYDIARAVRTRLSTSPERDWRPVWSPAGDEVAFTSNRAGNHDIFLRQADGSGEEKVLAATPHDELLSDWSRDGKYLLYHLYHLGDPETGPDLWYLERNEDSGWEPHPFLQAPFHQLVPRFSPDGRYVAYVSGESGQYEVYVQPFPEGGHKVTVSSNGGRKVRWSRDGKELFYVEGETLVAVSVSSGSSFSVGSATRLFEHPGLRPGFNYAPYDVSADGQRFILAEPVEEGADADAAVPSIRVVLNWFEEFRDHNQD